MYSSFKSGFRSRGRHDSTGSAVSPTRQSISPAGSPPDVPIPDPSEMPVSGFRRESTQSSFSVLSDAGPLSHSRARDRKNEPLGLHVVYEPPGRRTVDIIFVHGLGGTSRLSWSYDRNLANFWPKEWLPLEPGFKEARVLTFGYNAHFMSHTKDLFNISDFAKDLLLQMKTGTDMNVESLEIGEVPIIFVVHSMGGLVVKKAYILGTQDIQFKHILDTVRSIVFLATPHRGSNLAEMLNKFLTVSFQSPKQYVADLQKNSARISDINDQFQLHAEKLDLVSFFETLPTSVGVKKMIVVERDSAITGYPHEISAPLNADHHHVCKFISRRDANYVSVRNVVKSLVEKFKVQMPKKRRSVETDSLRSSFNTDEVMTRLGVEPRPTETLFSVMEQYVFGSCDWVLSNLEFASFMADTTLQPSVLHMTGGPGTGKSVMASFMVQHLESLGLHTQFWYFRYDNQLNRSNRQCLLSIAFQILASLPEYSHKVLSKSADIDSIARSDLRSLWQKLFLNMLDRLETAEQLYWVIDAVDESESAQAFFQLLGSLKHMRFPLRIILLTRSQTVTKHFDRLRTTLPPGRTSHLPLSTPRPSLKMFIDEKMNDAVWDDEELKTHIAEELLTKSQGSFLWLSLVMREVELCDTPEQVLETLRETPPELSAIYERLEISVTHSLRLVDAPLVEAILSWVACSERQLNEDELKEALRPKFPLLNLRHTVSRLCGDFVSVDKKGNVSLIHHTAKEFLTRSASTILRVDPEKAHLFILDKCLTTLTDPRFRLRLKSHGCTGLLRYCCLSWSHHMARSDLASPGPRNIVRRIAAFFSSPAILTWIEAVATAGQLSILTSTSRALVLFIEKIKHLTAHENPVERPLADIELLTSWATELVRIVGKFGTHLLQSPGSVYSVMPLFCPPDSIVGRQFASSTSSAALSSTPRVTGIANTAWDDSLAKFTLGQDQKPEAIYCLDSTFAILTSDKCVNLYDTSTLQELHRFRHDETIVAAQFSHDGSMLVTCGIRTVKVWNTASGRMLHTLANPRGSGRRGMRAVSIAFSHDSSEIIAFCVDNSIRRQRLANEDDGWQRVDFQAQDEPTVARGRGSPVCVCFSPDGSKIAVSYRAAQMSVWDTETGNRIGRCEARGGYKITRTDNTDYPLRLIWNPVTEHVLGIFLNGTIFRWDPMKREAEEMENHAILATEIACSADGRLIVTSQRDGSLKVFSFENFTLLFSLSSMMRPSAMVFSPDGRRIYDLRKNLCNVWQPNALIRVAEQDERSSDSASSHYDSSVAGSQVSEATAVILEPVTAVAAATDTTSTAYVFGNDAGIVRYFSSAGDTSPQNQQSQSQQDEQGEQNKQNEQIDQGVDLTCGMLGVMCVAFSSDGLSFAVASVDNKVSVHRLLQPGGQLDAQYVFRPEAMGSVLQTVLDLHGELLLVHTRDATRVWDTSTRSLVALQAHDGESCHWLAHPHERRGFLSIRPSTISYHFPEHYSEQHPDRYPDHEGATLGALDECRWDIDYQCLDSVDWSNVAPTLSRVPHNLENAADFAVHKVFMTPNHTDMLLQLSGPGPSANRREIRFILLSLSFLSSSGSTAGKDPATTALQPRTLPDPVLNLIEIPLGFIMDSQDQSRRVSSGSLSSDSGVALAFIDRDFWVRTWSLDDVEGLGCKRHFFLPRDWVNMDCLELAMVTVDGRFLCPRNGEVAVVHNGLWGTLDVDG